MLITVPLKGVLYWQMLFNYDNSMNSASIKHSIRAKLFQSVSMSTFMEEVTQFTHTQARSNNSMNFDLSAAYKAISASIESTFEFSEEISAFVSTTREQKNFHRESEYEEIREYEVGPYSRLELYQLNFKAPGIHYACNAFSTTKKPDEIVHLSIKMKPNEFISNIQVIYGSQESQAPPNRIREASGLSDDINHRHGGNYVWLVPEYTTNVQDAVTGFDLFIQSSRDTKRDLADGAGGDFRYLVPVKNPRISRKITEVALVRAKEGAFSVPGPQYDGYTQDINRNRRGDWLYFTWKSVEVF